MQRQAGRKSSVAATMQLRMALALLPSCAAVTLAPYSADQELAWPNANGDRIQAEYAAAPSILQNGNGLVLCSDRLPKAERFALRWC